MQSSINEGVLVLHKTLSLPESQIFVKIYPPKIVLLVISYRRGTYF